MKKVLFVLLSASISIIASILATTWVLENDSCSCCKDADIWPVD